MKKLAFLLSLLLFLSALFCGCGEKAPLETPAYLFDYHINSEKGYAVINGYYGDDSEVIIPAEIEGCKVYGIGYWAFWQNDKIESVTLPDSVEIIGMHAFALCENLHTIKFGESLKTIDEKAFSSCSALKNITFSGDAPEIEDIYSLEKSDKNVKIYYPKDKNGWDELITDNYTFIEY